MLRHFDKMDINGASKTLHNHNLIVLPMMKFISSAVLYLAFVTVATASIQPWQRPFFSRASSFLQQLRKNERTMYTCKDDCGVSVTKAACNSMCKSDVKEFRHVMDAVYAQAKKPLCGVNPNKMTFENVIIPFDMDKRKCSVNGALAVSIILLAHSYSVDSGVTTNPLYKQKATWTVAFRYGNVSCCPPTSVEKAVLGGNDPRCQGPVNVIFNIRLNDSFSFDNPKSPHIDKGSPVASVSVEYPGHLDISPKSKFEDALKLAMKTDYILIKLASYFKWITYILLRKCIGPKCDTC